MKWGASNLKLKRQYLKDHSCTLFKLTYWNLGFHECVPNQAFPQFVELWMYLKVLGKTTIFLMIFDKSKPNVGGNVVWRCNILSLVLTQRTHDADPWQYMHINYKHNKQSKMNIVSNIMSTYTNYIILWLDANGISKTKMLGVWE
jgi:hypothetical protein